MDGLAENAVNHIERKKAGLYALLDYWARNLEAHAKQHAPWEDKTGHARQSLHAGVDVGNHRYILFLSHGVEYGKWLELAHAGKYAIVNPTMDIHLPKIKETVHEFWEDSL